MIRRLPLACVPAAATLVATPVSADPTTVFVQFDRQHLVAGARDDAPNGVSQTLQWFDVQQVDIPAFTEGPDQQRAQLIAAVLQRVREQWSEVAVEFVADRPTDGAYLMITMGGHGSLVGLGNAGGWGIIDCYDENHVNVAFAFSETLVDTDGNHDVAILAQVISQEIAHTVGLEHLEGDDSFIMSPSTTGAAVHRFADQCETITGAITDPDHPEYCLDHPGCPQGEQNDLAHLVTHVGPAEPPADPGDTGTSDTRDTADTTGTTGTGSDSRGHTDTIDADPDGDTATAPNPPPGDAGTCRCRAPANPAPVTWMSLAWVVLLVRRRRPSASSTP